MRKRRIKKIVQFIWTLFRKIVTRGLIELLVASFIGGSLSLSVYVYWFKKTECTCAPERAVSEEVDYMIPSNQKILIDKG